MVTLKFYGHSCFELTEKNTSLIFDPFFTGNPWDIATAADVNPNYLLISHAHDDHLGDGLAIAKRTQATAISTFEVASLFSNENYPAHAQHIGGKHDFDFGWVKIIAAFHGAGVPGGHACGFLVNFFGTIVYFAGDTSLFGDMALINKTAKVDYALLPIGDNFTMGPEDALEAAKLVNPKTVIPMHYNTWPLIKQSAADFKAKVEKETTIAVKIVNPGETITL
ncbi:MAG: metal-dependent hydrolase [Sporomusaceae bacterium]|jgi:L-ascorbate metabolism protein UlaG (beta-lactamase superfamily)|nr:metal-dependent hydrolase [Sporomusaceae bacterium]